MTGEPSPLRAPIPAGILTLSRFRMVPGLRHGFTTRQAGTGRLDGSDLARRLGLAGFASFHLRQVHGNRIAVLRGCPEGIPAPEADGSATDRPGTVLWIRTADCLPVLLVDPDRRVLAACHAGWRGTSLGIARIGVETLVREFGSSPGRILAGLGPAIGECCYRVGEEVREAFRSRGLPADDDLFPSDPDGGLRLDLRRAVLGQVRAGGVPADRIQSLDLCTACHPEWFFSRRRDGAGPDRLHAFIAWAGAPGGS